MLEPWRRVRVKPLFRSSGVASGLLAAAVLVAVTLVAAVTLLRGRTPSCAATARCAPSRSRGERWRATPSSSPASLPPRSRPGALAPAWARRHGRSRRRRSPAERWRSWARSTAWSSEPPVPVA